MSVLTASILKALSVLDLCESTGGAEAPSFCAEGSVGGLPHLSLKPYEY